MMYNFYKKSSFFYLLTSFYFALLPSWGYGKTSNPTPTDMEQVLQAKLTDMLSLEEQKRIEAAHFVAALSSEHAPLLIRQLQLPLPPATFPEPALRALVWAIKAEFPNIDYPQKSTALWLAPPGQSVAAAEKVNWLESLAKVQAEDFAKAAEQLQVVFPQKPAPNLQPFFAQVRAHMLFRVAMLHALGKAGATGQFPSTLPIFDFGFVRNGIFRDECGKVIRNMGIYAAADLVRISGEKKGGAEKIVRRKYAKFQLDKMNLQSPKTALDSMGRNYSLRANLLHAYGEVQDGRIETLTQILNAYTTGSNPEKEAARWALLQYVEGPPPPEPPMRKRKRPGGIQEETETADYLNFRSLLVPLLRKTLQGIGNTAIKTLSLRELTQALFTHYEGQRGKEQDIRVAQGFAALKDNHPEIAVNAFLSVLVTTPEHPARKAMAPAFAVYGETLAQQGEAMAKENPARSQTLISQALGLLRRALLLDDSLPNANHIEARIHYLDGIQVQAMGGTGLPDFQQAVLADPSYKEAKSALETTSK